MAATLPSDMKIYDNLVQTGYVERQMDNLSVFNAGSNNAIQMISRIIPGDYEKNAYYNVGGDAERRDITSNDSTTDTAIGADEAVSVKCAWKYGPYAATYESFLRRARTMEEFSFIYGQHLADAALKRMITVGLAGLEGCFALNTDMVVDSVTVATDGKSALVDGMKKLGDKFTNQVCWVMHSSTYLDFIDKAISDNIFNEAGIVVYGGDAGTMGKPVVVTDQCNSNYIYGLQRGAIICTESQAPVNISQPITDQENIALRYRAEGAFNLEVMGYSWDPTAGGANPTDAALALAANWDQHATSDKSTAGFKIDLTAGS